MANTFYKSTVLFFYFWLCVVLPLFLYALLFNPTDSFIEFAKAQAWSKESINELQKYVYYLLGLASFGVAFLLSRWYSKSSNSTHRNFVMVFLSIVMVASAILLSYFPDELMSNMNSELRNNDKNIVLKKYKKFFDVQDIKGARNFEDIMTFERGPYYIIDKNVFLCPMLTDEEFYAYIVANKFKTVVSLLDPNNPNDAKWIEREERLMKRYKIKFVNLPTPNNANEKQLQTTVDSVLKMARPCMVHSFLGTSYINKAIVQFCCEKKKTCTLDQLEANERRYKFSKYITARRFEDIDKFERGPYFILGNNAYLSPMLTEEELYAYVIANKFKTVVSLLNPKNPSDVKWIKTERELLKPYKISFINIPTPNDASKERIEALSDSLLKLPRPILVHAFLSESHLCSELLKTCAIKGGKAKK